MDLRLKKNVMIGLYEYQAKKILELAKNGGYGYGIRDADLEVIVNRIIYKSMMATDRKIKREEKAREKVDRAQKLLASRDISNLSLKRENLTVNDLMVAAVHNRYPKYCNKIS